MAVLFPRANGPEEVDDLLDGSTKDGNRLVEVTMDAMLAISRHEDHTVYFLLELRNPVRVIG